MEKLKLEAFGGAEPLLFIFWMFIAFLSMYTTLFYRGKLKYKQAEGTPSSFSSRFLTRDNFQKLVISFFICYIGLRMSSVFFQTEASFLVAVGIGPASEVIADFFRKTEAKARD